MEKVGGVKMIKSVSYITDVFTIVDSEAYKNTIDDIFTRNYVTEYKVDVVSTDEGTHFVIWCDDKYEKLVIEIDEVLKDMAKKDGALDYDMELKSIEYVYEFKQNAKQCSNEVLFRMNKSNEVRELLESYGCIIDIFRSIEDDEITWIVVTDRLLTKNELKGVKSLNG